MKKTIITLLAMAGVAGAETGTLTLTNTTTNDVITTAISDNSTDWLKEAITLGGNAMVTIDTVASNTNNNGGDNSIYGPVTLSNYAIGDVNVGVANGGSYTYSVSFTVNEDAPALTLTSISAGFIVQSAAGGGQGARWATYNWQFVSEETTLIDYATDDYWSQSASSSSTGSLAMDFGSNAIDLVAGETYTLNLKITGVNNSKTEPGGGGFVHVGSISASIVPEPTTATLSLLALCGLAARRRRR